MASWDTPAVAAPSAANYAAPLVNFDAIANLGKDYYAGKEMAFKGREMQRQEDVNTAFRNGIPIDGAGDPNWRAASQKMLELGNYGQAITFQNTANEVQQLRNGQAAADRYLAPVRPGQAAPQPRNAPPVADNTPSTVMTVLAAQGIPNNQLQAAADSVARQLGVGPTDPIDTKDPRITNVLGPAIGQLKRARIGEVVQSGDGSPSQAAPSERVSQGFSDVGAGAEKPSTPDIHPKAEARVQSYLDSLPVEQRKAVLSNWAANPAFPKSLSAFAEKRLESIERGEEPTSEIKNAEYDSDNGGSLTRHEAGMAGAKKAATAPFEIAEAAVREGGRPISIKPNEVVATGNQVNPALAGITDWATRRLGVTSGAPAAPAPVPTPATDPNAPVPNAPSPPSPPNVAAAQPQPGRSAFTPQMVRNPDGSVASTVTPSTETLQKTAAQNYEKARESYAGSQEVQSQLATMEDAARQLNKAGWSTTGTGANARLALAKTVNSLWQAAGVKGQNLPFDPNAVASWEKLQKETTRLGFSLARTLGAREAMQIVAGAIAANPNAENSPLGFKMVLNTIRQNAERQSDYFTYATRYAQEHSGDLLGAEVEFNKLNPPSLYARRAIVQAKLDVPQEAIDALRGDPKSAAAFDEHYGQKGLAKMFLGNAGPQGVQ